MSKLSVIDNHSNKFSLKDKKGDLPNLRLIANKTIGDLQAESGILIFPPKVEETDDQIKDSVIFNLKESSDSFLIETGNIMGFIGCNDTELNIYSRFAHTVKDENGSYKISEGNDFFLHYMLEKVCHVNLTNLKSNRTPEKIFDFLPFLFPQYLTAALKQGLYKEYQTKEYNDSNVRGVIDVSRHIRFNIPANGKIAYRTREYSFDNPMTELVRHTIEYMRTNDSFKHILTRDEETKDAVAKIDNATALYNPMERNKILSKTSKAIKSPYFYKYRNLQKICRMILLREKIKYDSSANKIYGILFDGAWLWEEYLWTVLKKAGFNHPQNKTRKNGIHIHNGYICYPDFYKGKQMELNSTDDKKIAQSKINFVLDAKYKRGSYFNNFSEETRSSVQREDLYQLISYLHVLPAESGGLIYPYDKESAESIVVSEDTRELYGFGGKIKTYGIPIPQQIDDYKIFADQMKITEKEMIEFNWINAVLQ